MLWIVNVDQSNKPRVHWCALWNCSIAQMSQLVTPVPRHQIQQTLCDAFCGLLSWFLKGVVRSRVPLSPFPEGPLVTCRCQVLCTFFDGLKRACAQQTHACIDASCDSGATTLAFLWCLCSSLYGTRLGKFVKTRRLRSAPPWSRYQSDVASTFLLHCRLHCWGGAFCTESRERTEMCFSKITRFWECFQNFGCNRVCTLQTPSGAALSLLGVQVLSQTQFFCWGSWSRLHIWTKIQVSFAASIGHGRRQLAAGKTAFKL